MISLLFEARAGVSLEDPNVPLGRFTLLEALGGGSRSASGRRVSDETAKTISAVWSAVTTIASSVGSLPVRVVQYGPAYKTTTQVRDHPLHHLLNRESSPGVLAANFEEAAMGHLLLRGNMVTDVVRTPRLGELEALYLLDPDAYTIHREPTASGMVPMVLLRPTADRGVRALNYDRVFRVAGVGGDGVVGWSVIRYGRETFGLALGQEDYGARFFSNDATPRGVLEHPASLSLEAKDSLRQHWNGLYGGSANAHRVAVLEEGMEFKPIQLNAEDTQFIESRNFSIREVARWFNVPPHKIGDLRDATWSNIDAQNLEYLQDTLTPWLTRLVQATESQLLTDSERAARLGIQFDFRHLLRGDVAARSAYFQARFQTSSITPNEIRAEEGENPIDGGDTAFVQSQYIPVDMVEAMVAAQVQRANVQRVESRGDPPPPGAPPPPAGRAQPSAWEARAFDGRMALRDQYRPEILAAADRVVRGEVRELRKLVARHLEGEAVDADAFVAAAAAYYLDAFPAFAAPILAPILTQYALAVRERAADEVADQLDTEPPAVSETREFVQGYTEQAVTVLAASGRRAMTRTADNPDPAAAVATELDGWVDTEADTATRAERTANRHAVEMSNAAANFVWAAMGVAGLVSAVVGESCPYCRATDGRRVAIGQPFFRAGDVLDPEGAEVPLKFKSTRKYPPYHPGCDCVVRPEV